MFRRCLLQRKSIKLTTGKKMLRAVKSLLGIEERKLVKLPIRNAIREAYASHDFRTPRILLMPPPPLLQQSHSRRASSHGARRVR